MAKRKQYSAEFKQDAVNHYYSSGKTLEKAADDLKVAKSILSNWVYSANQNNGLVEHRGSGNYSSDAEKEIARLKKELKKLKGCARHLKKGYKHTEQLTESIYSQTKTESEKRKISVNSVLKILGVSSSGYYGWLKRTPSNQEKRKQSIKAEIIQIHNESHQIYGAPKITSILQSRAHKSYLGTTIY